MAVVNVIFFASIVLFVIATAMGFLTVIFFASIVLFVIATAMGFLTGLKGGLGH